MKQSKVLAEWRAFTVEMDATAIRYATRLCPIFGLDGSRAGDACQDAYVLIREKWAEVRRHPNPPGYLLLTIRNRLREMRRELEKADSLDPDLAISALDGDPEAVFLRRQATWRVLTALREMDARSQDAILLRQEGLNAKEIAGLVGDTHAAVRQRLSRATQILVAARDDVRADGQHG